MLDLKDIDSSWTLFLDRDGVINHEKHMAYVLNRQEFIFYDGVQECLKNLSRRFGKIIIVTNQRGVEKQLMTEDDLKDIHKGMVEEITARGGKIDAIFYCTSLSDDHPDRKPQAGMAFLAQQRFPDIVFSKSVMVGNNISDMEFGSNAGMYTVFVQTTSPDLPLPHPAIDVAFKDLTAFTNAVASAF